MTAVVAEQYTKMKNTENIFPFSLRFGAWQQQNTVRGSGFFSFLFSYFERGI
jgi:hypothetical protein